MSIAKKYYSIFIMDSLTINRIFGYQYTKVHNCEYVPLGLELKQYVLFQAFTLCWYSHCVGQISLTPNEDLNQPLVETMRDWIIFFISS